MKTPSFRTWLLGSACFAPFIIGGAGWYSWEWASAGGPDNTGLITIALMGCSAKAAYEVAAYRRWRADWRAMAPGGEKPGYRPKPTTIVAVLGMMAVGAAMFWASSSEAPVPVHNALMPIVMLCALLGIALLPVRALYCLWARFGQRQGKLPAVTLAIQRSLLRVPSIRTCYRRLPPHCQMLMRGGKS